MRSHPEADENGNPENWRIIRNMLAFQIERADWQDADCMGTIEVMAEHFKNALPGIGFSLNDLKLALHDLNIPFERNEHNNKFYYLAKWL